MRKNVAGQVVGTQLFTLDGLPFSAAVACYVTGDNGTQTLGSVGGGAATSKGRGYYSYAPSQSETNYDHIAFTFVETGSPTEVSATVQVYTQVGADIEEISGSTTAAENLSAGANVLVVSTVASGPSITLIPTNLTEESDDHYNGRTITFRTGVLAGQSSDITDYVGSSKDLTVTALTEAPSQGDEFVIS